MAVARVKSLAPILLASSIVGCAPPILTVEVLPPRTSVTCAAPAVGDPALGRGLLDVQATDTEHGGYVGDLRLTVTGADARVNGFTLTYGGDLGGTAAAFDGEIAVGDAALVGESDEIRRGILENVALVPGALAAAIDDGDSEIGATRFKALTIEILPLFASVAPVEAATNTFALDVCKGCLVAEPDAEECPNGATRNAVCRVGQDVELFRCAQAPVVIP